MPAGKRPLRLLYLCSLPHSGSTLLSLFLGGNESLVGLGAIERSVGLLIDHIGRGVGGGRLDCTCGQPALECPYWGEVARELPDGTSLDLRQRYEVALRVFRAVFGDEAWPVDSSKHVEQLVHLAAVPGIDLRVIHLVKDVRSNAISAIDRRRRAGDCRRPNWLLAMEGFHRWRRENGKIDSSLRDLRLPHVQVGYEELCLSPEVVAQKIGASVGLPYERLALELGKSRSHLIAGNRMRGQLAKQVLRYDNRWFMRTEWMPAAMLFPQVMKYNLRVVYGNRETVWAG